MSQKFWIEYWTLPGPDLMCQDRLKYQSLTRSVYRQQSLLGSTKNGTPKAGSILL